MSKEQKDNLPFLIVGQGLAGSLVAWFLYQHQYPFTIIDNGHRTSASTVAAGLIHPITGRRFVKSWMIETLLPFAKKTYQDIASALGIQCWEEKKFVRFFQNNAEGNNWLTKTTWEGYDRFLKKEKIPDEVAQLINSNAGYGVVAGAKVNLELVVKTLQTFFLNNNQLQIAPFHHTDIALQKSGVSYQGKPYRGVIFCEGFKAAENPWFHQLPYESAKGEVLIIRIPALQTEDILKKHYFIAPEANDKFWFGSNYEWDDLTPTPTPDGRAFLEKELSGILKPAYEVVAHLAAVRPVLKDRRPALGAHPIHPQLHFFNGLGTKGTSLAPYWAEQLVLHLLKNEDLPPEVQVARFWD